MKNIALILASGNGSRFGSECPKQFIQIDNKTILEYSVEVFHSHELIDEIIVVTNPDWVDDVQNTLKNYSKVQKVIAGGEIRQKSSYNGVFSIDYDEANILIHDGARPLISEDVITKCIKSLNEYNAVCVAVKSTDTILKVDDKNNLVEVPERKNLRCAQTPQCFKLSLIKKAHEKAKADVNCSVTDDCGLIINYTNEILHIVEGNIENIKITYPDDIDFFKKHK